MVARQPSSDRSFMDQAVHIVVTEIDSLERRVRAFSDFASEPPVRASTIDVDALIGLLDPDATVIADGGGLVGARLRPVTGRERIARASVDVTRLVPDLTLLERTVNGQPGLIAQQDGATITVFAFRIAGDRITHIWAVRNPEKLRPWTAD